MTIPVTIFSGFLGSGKTTLIRALLRNAKERDLDTRFAVVVNEFGHVSIDGPSIADAVIDGSVEVTNITGGLIAYSSDDKFDGVLSEIGDRQGELDHLIIETSGLAVPTAIVERLASCGRRFALDAIIVVVDTPELLQQGERAAAVQEVFVKQLDAADVVVLNKIDELSHEEVHRSEALLRSLSPTIKFVELAYHAEIDSRLLLGVNMHATRKMQAAGVLQAPAATAATGAHEHAGWGHHVHGLRTHEHLHEHDPGWLSFALHCHEPQDPATLVDSITHLMQHQPIFRAKGYFESSDHQRHELQAVGERVTVTVAPRDKQHEHGSELIFIGHNAVRDAVIAELAKATRTDWH